VYPERSTLEGSKCGSIRSARLEKRGISPAATRSSKVPGAVRGTFTNRPLESNARARRRLATDPPGSWNVTSGMAESDFCRHMMSPELYAKGTWFPPMGIPS